MDIKITIPLSKESRYLLEQMTKQHKDILDMIHMHEYKQIVFNSFGTTNHADRTFRLHTALYN